jgi:hypothetical protein
MPPASFRVLTVEASVSTLPGGRFLKARTWLTRRIMSGVAPSSVANNDGIAAEGAYLCKRQEGMKENGHFGGKENQGNVITV